MAHVANIYTLLQHCDNLFNQHNTFNRLRSLKMFVKYKPESEFDDSDNDTHVLTHRFW